MKQKRYSRNEVKKVYGSATRLKMQSSQFSKHIEKAYLSGRFSILYEIFELNKENNFQDIDELLGELHKIYASESKEMTTKYLNNPFYKVEIEDILKHEGRI